MSEPRRSERVAVQTGQTMTYKYYTENKRLGNMTPTKTVSEPRRSGRVVVPAPLVTPVVLLLKQHQNHEIWKLC